MEHPGNRDPRWIDLYVTGRLSAADEADFEMHLLECAACREDVRVAEDLKRALAQTAADQVYRQVAAHRLARLMPRGRLLRRALAVGLGLALLALPAWLWRGRRQLERELAAARTELAAARPDPRLAGELRDERRRGEELARQLDQLRLPQGVAATVSLGFLRDEPGRAQVVHLPREAGLMLLSIDPPAAGSRYEVTVVGADGRPLGPPSAVAPSPLDGTLPVFLHSSVLSPGSYRLRLRPAGAPAAAVREIPLRVVR